KRGPARLEDAPITQPPSRTRAVSQILVSLQGRGELRDLPALRRVDEDPGMLRVFRVLAIEVVSAQDRPGPVAATFRESEPVTGDGPRRLGCSRDQNRASDFGQVVGRSGAPVTPGNEPGRL